jgi:hypothetical protein
LLVVRRRRQRHNPKDAGAGAIDDRLDRAALPGGVTAFKDDDDALLVLLYPRLQAAQLFLKLAQLLLVGLSVELSVSILLGHHAPVLVSEAHGCGWQRKTTGRRLSMIKVKHLAFGGRAGPLTKVKDTGRTMR